MRKVVQGVGRLCANHDNGLIFDVDIKKFNKQNLDFTSNKSKAIKINCLKKLCVKNRNSMVVHNSKIPCSQHFLIANEELFVSYKVLFKIYEALPC